MTLNALKARLGSLSPTTLARIEEISDAAILILRELPRVIERLEASERVCEAANSLVAEFYAADLSAHPYDFNVWFIMSDQLATWRQQRDAE